MKSIVEILECHYQETNRFCRRFARGHLQIPTLMANFLMTLFFTLNVLSISVFFVELPTWFFQVFFVGIFLLLTWRFSKLEDTKYSQPFGKYGVLFVAIYYLGSLAFLIYSTYNH